MMAFAGDGQADRTMIDARDRALGLSTTRQRRNRSDIPTPDVAPEANP